MANIEILPLPPLGEAPIINDEDRSRVLETVRQRLREIVGGKNSFHPDGPQKHAETIYNSIKDLAEALKELSGVVDDRTNALRDAKKEVDDFADGFKEEFKHLIDETENTRDQNRVPLPRDYFSPGIEINPDPKRNPEFEEKMNRPGLVPTAYRDSGFDQPRMDANAITEASTAGRTEAPLSAAFAPAAPDDDLQRRGEIEVEIRKPRVESRYWRDPAMQDEYRGLIARMDFRPAAPLAPRPGDPARKAEIEAAMREGPFGPYWRRGSTLPDEYRAILEREANLDADEELA